MSDHRALPARIAGKWAGFVFDRRLLLAPAVLVTSLGILWALSQPLSSAPDEPEHIIRAVSLYSGSGIKVPLQVVGQTFYGSVRAPEYFVHGLPRQGCVVNDAASPATCASRHVSHPRRIVETETSAAGHPPVYYLLVGWIGRLFPSGAGVMLMRIWSALMCGLLIAAATITLSRRVGSMYPAVVALTAFSPVAAFMAGSVNPQSFEICFTLAAFALTWALFSDLAGRGDASPPRPVRYLVLLAASLGLGLTRPLSAVFLLAAAGAAIVLARIPLRQLLRPPALLGTAAAMAGVVAAVLFEVLAGHSSVQLIPAEAPSTFSAIQRLLDTVGTMVIQAGGAVSSLEAGASSLAVGGFMIAAITTLLVSLLVGERRATSMAFMALTATLALPVVANIPNAVELNLIIWQGRYGLPLLAVSLAAAGLALTSSEGPTDQRLRGRSLAIVCWAMAVAHFGGWWFAMYRWAVGIGGPMWWPARAGWSPRMPWWLLGAGVLVTCAFYAVVLPAAATRYESDTKRGNVNADVVVDEQPGAEVEAALR